MKSRTKKKLVVQRSRGGVVVRTKIRAGKWAE